MPLMLKTESYMKMSAKNGITSHDGEITPYSYLKATGLTAFNELNAPLLKLSKYFPFEVPPSGKMQIGGYSPIYSINYYLAPISSTI